MDISEVRGLFPDREFPTDEEIAEKKAENEAVEAEVARLEAERQEKIAELERQLAELRG